MTRAKIVAGIAILAVASGASAAAPGKSAPGRSSATSNSVEALVQNCEAHKFETVIQLTGDDGKARSSKVKLCGNQGQSDADWIRTLKDAVTKASQSSDMPKAAKEQIVAAINAEIERLNGAAPSSTETAIEDAPRSAEPEAPLSRDYALLPPLPVPTSVAPPPILLPPSTGLGASAETAGSKRERKVATPALASIGTGTASGFSLRCALPTDPQRSETCDILEPSTLLVLRADAAATSATQLRFVRRGALHGEVTVPPLRHGQSATFRAPTDVCAGVVRSRVSIEAGGGTIGEYELRC